MNTLDAIFLSLLILFGFRGLFRGLVREALSLGALAAGFLAAGHVSGLLAPHLAVHIHNPQTVGAVAALLAFLGGVGLVWLAARLLSRALTYSPAASMDKGLGCLFGLGEGYLLCLALLYLLRSVAPEGALVRDSSLAPLLLPGMRALSALLPENLRLILRGGV